MEAASTYNVPTKHIIFEVTEGEEVEPVHLRKILDYYRGQGCLTAIDDFGAGYAGLGLLCDFKPDLVKSDMKLIRNIDSNPRRQAIFKGIISLCRDLDIQVIAEGVETYEEMAAIRDFGVYLFQGYYFAEPAFQSLAEVPSELLGSS